MKTSKKIYILTQGAIHQQLLKPTDIKVLNEAYENLKNYEKVERVISDGCMFIYDEENQTIDFTFGEKEDYKTIRDWCLTICGLKENNNE